MKNRLHSSEPGSRWLGLTAALALILPLCAGALQAQEVMTPERLWEIPRVSGPAVSPDGQSVAYGVTRYDLTENRGSADLFLVPVSGGDPFRLTDTPASEHSAAWRPDGEWIGFLSAAGGSTQLWEIRPDGTGRRQVTHVAGGISNFRYSPSGSHISFTSRVKLDPVVVDVHPDLPRADARVIDELMYRHWDSWREADYSHLFIAEYLDGAIGKPTDVMPGERWDTPLNPFGGGEQIGWNHDGSRIVYTAKKVTGAEYALTTNSELYAYDLATRQTTNLTDGMLGYDIDPVFSPDGRFMAFLSMERDGYEADRNRLFVVDLDRGQRRELSVRFDQDASSPAWSSDSRTIFFSSDVEGTVQLYSANAETGEIERLTEGDVNYYAFDVAEGSSGRFIVAQRVSMSAPAELFRVDPAGGSSTRLTFHTEPVMGQLTLGEVKARWVTSSDGERVHAWVIYPPNFDPNQQYPTLLYAQGGPQGTVSQFFSFRWNFQLMAANGYIIVAPNRRGVPSFGQDFKEEISGDWGGQAMQDLLAAIDDVAEEPYVDENRLGAIGASFGGYTVFWLAGNHEGRFQTFVAHAGVFNLESMYGATEELFFPHFDLEGAYWETPRPKSYDLFSPHNFAQNWDTPMLIIHGQKDFRVPVTEGMQAFTVLQSKGIESRFLYYPEEGHWILSPQNGVLWHRTFFEWLGRTLKPATS
jgi:dipeptidyl aminopeptidase/acylaminoacyl peptidase